MKPLVRLINLGRMSYRDCLKVQVDVMREVLNDVEKATKSGEQLTTSSIRNSLILVEHDPVYTIGIRSREYSTELEDKLKLLGADFVRTNRGGLITFHGPGQLVVYPILYLGSFNANRSIKWYVHQLEKSIITTCQGIDGKLAASVVANFPGVWIDDQRKIAAIGVHCKKYVTIHGAAINCNVNLEWFDHIVPCGIPDKKVTSISNEIGREFTIDQAIPYLLNAFSKCFNCTIN